MEMKLKESEDNLKMYVSQMNNIEKEKGKHLQKQIELEVKNQQLDSKVQEQLRDLKSKKKAI